MKELMIFEGNNVEVFEIEGKVLFNPRHVAKCLELGDSAVRMAIKEMNEKQVVKLRNPDVSNVDIRKLNNAGENFLTESGVYKLIFKSRKESAERFQDWVTDEVLPSIRQNGFYINKKANNLNIEKLEQELEEMKEKYELLEGKYRLVEGRNRLLSEENKTIKFYDKQVTGAWITINWEAETLRVGNEVIDMEFVKAFTSKYLNKHGLPKVDRESVQRIRIIDRQMKISKMCLESIIASKGRENIKLFMEGK